MIRSSRRNEPEPLGGASRWAVVLLESRFAGCFDCICEPGSATRIVGAHEWDPSGVLGERDGSRLLEEVERQLSLAWATSGVDARHLSGVVVTMPGTVAEGGVVRSSSRLGIREVVDFGAVLGAALDLPVLVYHDLDCIAVGEWVSDYEEASAGSGTLVYLFADEGIGSKLLIDGRPYKGAGAAGNLGRMIVQPHGAFYRDLQSRGALEVYASRPWVSENLVSLYVSERRKRPTPGREAFEDSPMRRALASLAPQSDWTGLEYRWMAQGLKDEDPLASATFDTAAFHLALGINAIMSICNPHVMVFGGSMFTKLPGFFEMVLERAREFAWPLAWNNTRFALSQSSREAQVLGAVDLASSA